MLDKVTGSRPLVLPPPYTAHRLASGDVLADACKRAPVEGAGCLVWLHAPSEVRPGRLDFAVVLEPETALDEARRAFIIGMAALGDALAAHCPPERDVRFAWPGEVILDTCRIGGMRLAVAPETTESEVPAWMALGVELIADRDHLDRPGDHPQSVSLKEEEFTDPLAVLESFASYLMLNFDRWEHQGFASVADRYKARLTEPGGISDTGNLERDGKQFHLTDSLMAADWRDENGPLL